MKTLTALDLRKKLGSILDDVSKRKEQVIISRANKPLAVMISIDEYEEKVLKKNREKKLKAVGLKLLKWKKQHKKEITHLDVVRALRQIRESR